MKFIKTYAILDSYILYHGKKSPQWRCPNRDCRRGVSKEYVCCPWCGQKLKFKEPENEATKYIRELMQPRERNYQENYPDFKE